LVLTFTYSYRGVKHTYIEIKDMEVIWILLLTVCSSSHCATQTVQWFDEKPKCIEMKLIHEKLPKDGAWKSIEYTCTVKGGIQV